MSLVTGERSADLSGAVGRAKCGAAAREVDRDVLAGHLEMIRLPARTATLLGRAERGPATIEAWVTRIVADRLERLLDGLCNARDEAGLVTRARALSGLGPGLTPTGDDLLVGVAAACGRLVEGGYWPQSRRAALVSTLAGMGDTGTTAVARAMVSQAAAGCFPAELDRFVALLGDRATEAAQIEVAVARLAAIGAHSGADMLAGAVALAARACREGETG